MMLVDDGGCYYSQNNSQEQQLSAVYSMAQAMMNQQQQQNVDQHDQQQVSAKSPSQNLPQRNFDSFCLMCPVALLMHGFQWYRSVNRRPKVQTWPRCAPSNSNRFRFHVSRRSTLFRSLRAAGSRRHRSSTLPNHRHRWRLLLCNRRRLWATFSFNSSSNRALLALRLAKGRLATSSFPIRTRYDRT